MLLAQSSTSGARETCAGAKLVFETDENDAAAFITENDRRLVSWSSRSIGSVQQNDLDVCMVEFSILLVAQARAPPFLWHKPVAQRLDGLDPAQVWLCVQV